MRIQETFRNVAQGAGQWISSAAKTAGKIWTQLSTTAVNLGSKAHKFAMPYFAQLRTLATQHKGPILYVAAGAAATAAIYTVATKVFFRKAPAPATNPAPAQP